MTSISLRFPLVLHVLNLPNSLILPKPNARLLHLPMAINLINRLKILRPHLMYNIRTIRFIPLLLLEKSQLPSLTKFLQIIIQIPVVNPLGLHPHFTVLVHVVYVYIWVVYYYRLVDWV